MRPFLSRIVVWCLSLVAPLSAQADDWPQWRGPYFNGSTDEKDLPANWSQTENIAWAADLPGSAASTPVVCGRRVLLPGVDTAKDVLQVMCYDRADGKSYLINFDGEVAVVNATNGDLLRVIPMDEPDHGEMVRSSIIAAHGQLFIRTTRRLYCVGSSNR